MYSNKYKWPYRTFFLTNNLSASPKCKYKTYFHNCTGTYIFADGSKYIGEFKDHKFHGKGTYYFSQKMGLRKKNMSGSFYMEN